MPRLFADDGIRRLLITAEGTHCTPPSGVEIIALPALEGNIEPSAIVMRWRVPGCAGC